MRFLGRMLWLAVNHEIIRSLFFLYHLSYSLKFKCLAMTLVTDNRQNTARKSISQHICPHIPAPQKIFHPRRKYFEAQENNFVAQENASIAPSIFCHEVLVSRISATSVISVISICLIINRYDI